MGNFYTNIALKGPDQKDVVEFLRKEGRVSYVSPTVRGITMVYDEESENQDGYTLAHLAFRLSKSFGCPAWAVLNHDDSVLLYWLYREGKLIDEYCSYPAFFGEDDEVDYEMEEMALPGVQKAKSDTDFNPGSLNSPDFSGSDEPFGGNGSVLLDAFGVKDDIDKIDDALKQTPSEEGFIFEVDRHGVLADALGVPSSVAHFGYVYITAGELDMLMDGDFEVSEFIKTP